MKKINEHLAPASRLPRLNTQENRDAFKRRNYDGFVSPSSLGRLSLLLAAAERRRQQQQTKRRRGDGWDDGGTAQHSAVLLLIKLVLVRNY